MVDERLEHPSVKHNFQEVMSLRNLIVGGMAGIFIRLAVDLLGGACQIFCRDATPNSRVPRLNIPMTRALGMDKQHNIPRHMRDEEMSQSPGTAANQAAHSEQAAV